jgi:hypothetical protein
MRPAPGHRQLQSKGTAPAPSATFNSRILQPKTSNGGAERRAIATLSYGILSTLPDLLGKPKMLARPFLQWLGMVAISWGELAPVSVQRSSHYLRIFCPQIYKIGQCHQERGNSTTLHVVESRETTALIRVTRIESTDSSNDPH